TRALSSARLLASESKEGNLGNSPTPSGQRHLQFRWRNCLTWCRFYAIPEVELLPESREGPRRHSVAPQGVGGALRDPAEGPCVEQLGEKGAPVRLLEADVRPCLDSGDPEDRRSGVFNPLVKHRQH